jgi:DNA-binding CsgD family transcriptional regulator
MSGKKIEQARDALRFVLDNLRDGDLFNIIAYDSEVESFRPELAWACYDYAEALKQRKAPGDSEKARCLLKEALSLSQELGMSPLIQRVVALKERTDYQPKTGPAYPDGLTQREVEVLRQVAAGKRDREIAEELVIAEGTVRRHVSNIYNKIGAINRSEATRYALRAGLLEELQLHIAPVVLGAGERLLENVGDPKLEQVEVVAGLATHVKYRVG